jgi:hypothetical protein
MLAAPARIFQSNYMEFCMSDIKVDRDVPVPETPTRRGRPPKNNDTVPDNQGQQGQKPQVSTAKIIELAKAEAAPAADLLNRDPAATGPDPYDLETAVYDQAYLDEAATEDLERPLKIRKPTKKEYFRVLPYFQCFNLYEDAEDGRIDKDFYIVMPSMAVAMEGETFKAELRLCVNTHEVAFLWPRRVPEEGQSNANWETGDAVKAAEKQWLRMVPKHGQYQLRVSKGDLGEPQFPATDPDGYKRILNVSVPIERRIADREHPIFYYKVEGRKR